MIGTSRWHLKREIQVGHIITTLTVAVASVLYLGRLEQRIALMEQQVISQHERDERQDRSVTESATLLRANLDRIEGKLDRLIESRGNRLGKPGE